MEFNLFKYSVASRKQFRIGYYLLQEHADYDTCTVYDRCSDDYLSNEIRVNFTYQDTWGSLSSTFRASCYLNDFDQYYLGSYNSASINLAKGFSFYITFGFSYMQDQSNLPKNDATWGDMFIGNRELESDFNYNAGIGIAYRFGSIYNNAVNPRFGY